MPYAIQTEWLLMMEALRYVLYLVSAVTSAGFVAYLFGLAVLCRNEARRTQLSKEPRQALAYVRAHRRTRVKLACL